MPWRGWPGRKIAREAAAACLMERMLASRKHCLGYGFFRRIDVGPTARASESDLYSPGVPSQPPPALMIAARTRQYFDPVTLRPEIFPPEQLHVTMGHERRTDSGGTLRRWRSPQSISRNVPSRRLRVNTATARAGSASSGSRGETAAAPDANPHQARRSTRPGALREAPGFQRRPRRSTQQPKIHTQVTAAP